MYFVNIFVHSVSDGSVLGVLVSDRHGLCIASRGDFNNNNNNSLTSATAAAHLHAIMDAATQLSFDGSEQPVIQIRTDKSQFLIANTEGYTTAIHKKLQPQQTQQQLQSQQQQQQQQPL